MSNLNLINKSVMHMMNVYKFESKFINYESGYYIFQLNKAIDFIQKYVNFNTVNTDALMDSMVDIIFQSEDNITDDNIDKYICISSSSSTDDLNSNSSNNNEYSNNSTDDLNSNSSSISDNFDTIEFKFTNEDCIKKIYTLFIQFKLI